MKTLSPMIDPKVFQADVLKLMTNDTVHGLTVNEVSSILANRDAYAPYPADCVLEWAQSMLDKLTNQGLIVLKGSRYFPGKPTSILQDTPAKPEEYLPPEIVGGNSS